MSISAASLRVRISSESDSRGLSGRGFLYGCSECDPHEEETKSQLRKVLPQHRGFRTNGSRAGGKSLAFSVSRLRSRNNDCTRLLVPALGQAVAISQISESMTKLEFTLRHHALNLFTDFVPVAILRLQSFGHLDCGFELCVSSFA